jgi:hypothetical protein
VQPGDLARKHGQVRRPVPDGDRYSAAHELAATLNGWNVYGYHYDLDLTDEEYLDALECAKAGYEAVGNANKRSG